MNVFEYATRNKLRFETEKGLITTEDLWKLSLTHLDDLAVKLYTELNTNVRYSFIQDVSKENNELQIKFDIVKYILDIRLEEKKQQELKVERTQQKQKLLEILDQKKNESLTQLSIEEIQAKLAEL